MNVIKETTFTQGIFEILKFKEIYFSSKNFSVLSKTSDMTTCHVT